MKLLKIAFILIFMFDISFCQSRPKESKKMKENVSSRYNLMSGADIKAMVQEQIDSARARDFRGEIKSCMFYDNSQEDVIYADNENSASVTKPTIEIDPRILMLAVFSIFVFLFVFIRRIIKNRNLPAGLIEQKTNESAEQDVIIDPKTDFEEIRNKLNPDIKETSLPSKTKGMKIAQGEMILAAKIRSYQLEHFGNK